MSPEEDLPYGCPDPGSAVEESSGLELWIPFLDFIHDSLHAGVVERRFGEQVRDGGTLVIVHGLPRVRLGVDELLGLTLGHVVEFLEPVNADVWTNQL